MTWVLRAALLLFLGILVVFSGNVSPEPVGLVLRIDTLDATALRGMATHF